MVGIVESLISHNGEYGLDPERGEGLTPTQRFYTEE